MPDSEKALLFDIDGTLADTDALHLQAFNQIFGPRGHVFDRARASKELMGFSNASIGERFLPDEPPQRRLAIMEQKEAAFRKLVAGKIEPMPGLMRLLARADQAGVPMVAVTNAPRLNAEMLLAGLGISDRFKRVVIGDELSPRQAASDALSGRAARGERCGEILPRLRGFALRRSGGVRGRHCNGRDANEPWPCRFDRSRCAHDRRKL